MKQLLVVSKMPINKTQLLALFFMNLDHEPHQLGVPLPYKGTKSSPESDPLFVS